MPSGKDRLYVALYARPGKAKMPGLEDTYHWGFLVGPKVESNGTGAVLCLHAKETMTVVNGRLQSTWRFEERDAASEQSMLLVRIVVGKIKSLGSLRVILAQTPIREGTPGWNCVAWAREAYEAAVSSGMALGTTSGDWEKVREAAMHYIERKEEERRFGVKDMYRTSIVPTWDMLRGKETFA